MFTLCARSQFVWKAFRGSIRSLCSKRVYGHSETIIQSEQVSEQYRRNAENHGMSELVRDFINPSEFYQALSRSGINFFCGVPDSLLKDICSYIGNMVPPDRHVITCNEGAAIGLATGYHLATGGHPLVYMQNSGLGNCVNPLTSLCSNGVYSIPMLLLIGWRGQPGKRDEPQHLIQGSATPGLLATMGIPFQTLPDYIDGAEQVLNSAREHMLSTKTPYALLVRKQTFLPFSRDLPKKSELLSREESLEAVVSSLNLCDPVISTTGMLSRELFELRAAQVQGHFRDFLTVGSMGHASSIALGVALNRPQKQVWLLDGDGASLMHLGSMASIGTQNPKNLRHILFNNGAHDSVGGDETAAANPNFSFVELAKACGYRRSLRVSSKEEIDQALGEIQEEEGPSFLEIAIKLGYRADLGRPHIQPTDNKADFMRFLSRN